MGVLEIRTYDQLAIVSNCRVSVAQLVARSGLYREVLGSIPSTDILLFDCLMLYYTIYIFLYIWLGLNLLRFLHNMMLFYHIKIIVDILELKSECILIFYELCC